MLLAQEAINAVSASNAQPVSDLLTISLAVVATSGIALRELLTFIGKSKRTGECEDVRRRLDSIEKRLQLSAENKLRIEELGRGMVEVKERVSSVAKNGQEVRDIVITVRTIVDSWGAQ